MLPPAKTGDAEYVPPKRCCQIGQISFPFSHRNASQSCDAPDHTSYSTTTTGWPSTSMRGVTPRPGAVEAASRPLTRCGAPSAIETVT